MGFVSPPLGNTVTYSLWAHLGQFGMYIIDRSQARPGDLLLWSRDGNMSHSGGNNGHGMIVESIAPNGSFNTMESWGRHGPGFNNRERGWVTEVVRINGITAADVEDMRALTRWCIRRGVIYYSGVGDNDHDGITDRADLDDRRSVPGVDCTGFNWDCWQAAQNTNNYVPPPPPKPPAILPMNSEDNDMPQMHYEPIKQTHAAWVPHEGPYAGHLLHAWTAQGMLNGFVGSEVLAGPTAPGTRFLTGPGNTFIPGTVSMGLDPCDLSMAICVEAKDGHLNRFSWAGAAGPWKWTWK